MQKIRSHEWDVGIQGCRICGGRINEGRLYNIYLISIIVLLIDIQKSSSFINNVKKLFKNSNFFIKNSRKIVENSRNSKIS